MKITLTMAEITALVAERFQLPSSTQIEIEELNKRANTIISARLVETLKARNCLTSDGSIRSDKKIEAIKAVREVYFEDRPAGTLACGLANAKSAVEEWGKFLPYVQRYGFPDMTEGVPPKWR